MRAMVLSECAKIETNPLKLTTIDRHEIERPNEILLKISFEELFSAPINRGLPDYLNLSYTFFGWWIISIGMLILAFTVVTRLATSLSRVLISFVLLIILIGLTIIEKMYIPTSPFLYLTWGAWILWVISVWAGIQLQKHDA